MSKSLKHYKSKRRNNKTQRLRKGRKGHSKMTGGYKVFPDDQTDLHELEELLGQPNRHLLALHSSEACGHCKKIKPEWTKMVSRLTPHPNMMVAKLGQGATDYMNEHHYRKHNHAVNGVPTIVYYIVNNKPQEYDGERTADKIINWLTKVMTDNNLELTLKSKTQDEPMSTHLDDSVIQEQPYPEPSAPEFTPDQTDMQTGAPITNTVTTADAPTGTAPTGTAPTGTAPTPTPEVAATATPTADVFPEAPLPPASTLSNATETIKGAAETVDNKIAEVAGGISKTLTADIGSLFSSDTKSLPPIPSLVGGVRPRRTRRRRKHSKKSKHSKKH